MSSNIVMRGIHAIGIIIIDISAWLWGPVDALFVGYLFFAGVDVITGMVAAYGQGVYDSSKFSLKKKIGVLVAVAVLYRLDIIIPSLGEHIDFFDHWVDPLRNFALACYITNDVASIFENLGHWGVPIPAIISRHLKQLQSKVAGEQKGENAGS